MQSQGQALRKQFMSEFRGFDHRNGLLAALCIVLANIALACLAAYTSFQLFLKFGFHAIPAYIICIFLIGTRYRALANIIHECSHYSFTKRRPWNEIFGRLLSIPLFSSFGGYRRSHQSHHQHLGDDDKDLDFQGLGDFGFGEMINRLMVIRHLLTTMTLRHVPLYIGRVFYVKEDAPFYNGIRGLYIAGVIATPVVFGFSSIQFLVMVAYLLIPYAITLQIITYWQDALDHAGVIKNADELYQTRNSILENRLLRAILFPRNDCYHLVHHLFPHVPVTDLPASHALLMGDAEYAALHHGVMERTRSLWWPGARA